MLKAAAVVGEGAFPLRASIAAGNFERMIGTALLLGDRYVERD